MTRPLNTLGSKHRRLWPKKKQRGTKSASSSSRRRKRCASLLGCVVTVSLFAVLWTLGCCCRVWLTWPLTMWFVIPIDAQLLAEVERLEADLEAATQDTHRFGVNASSPVVRRQGDPDDIDALMASSSNAVSGGAWKPLGVGAMVGSTREPWCGAFSRN